MKMITLETVQNGYTLRPDSFLRDGIDRSVTRVEEIYVFHTLDEVMAWLSENLETPKEPTATMIAGVN